MNGLLNALLKDTRQWLNSATTHVALPTLLFVVHLFAKPLWHDTFAAPSTLWTVALFALIFWMAGGLTHYLDVNGYLTHGPLAEFFGTVGLDESDEVEDTI